MDCVLNIEREVPLLVHQSKKRDSQLTLNQVNLIFVFENKEQGIAHRKFTINEPGHLQVRCHSLPRHLILPRHKRNH